MLHLLRRAIGGGDASIAGITKIIQPVCQRFIVDVDTASGGCRRSLRAPRAVNFEEAFRFKPNLVILTARTAAFVPQFASAGRNFSVSDVSGVRAS